MEEKLIKTTELPNGLVLNIYDGSWKIADKGKYQSKHEAKAQRRLEGDIWLISVILRIEIPILESYFSQDEASTLTRESVIEVLGDAAVFEKKMDRHYVHSSEKDEVFENAMKDVQATMVQYLSHPEFGRKYVFKLYAEETSPTALHAKGLL
ncbi:MAG: hypothetical protein JEZ02_00580 [Desulfatibacillum sp.]|nr:hypothetical protein [Desulfatibacillum sp.]